MKNEEWRMNCQEHRWDKIEQMYTDYLKVENERMESHR